MAADIDTPAVRDWLSRHVPGLSPDMVIEKFSGGQSNPTYRISSLQGRFALRRKPFGDLLPSAHAIEREYRLISVLHPQGFPVPRPILLCEDKAVLGSAFYVMGLVEGRNFWDGTLPDVAASGRAPLYHVMVDTLAQLHSIVPDDVGLGDFGRPGNYFKRQVGRWTKQYRAAQTEDIPEVERLIPWLTATVPPQTRSSVIHGDYRIANLIFAPDRPQVNAVLDWELATIGDPLADLAYLAMNWVMPIDGRAGLAGTDFAESGIPTLDEVVQRYCAATGRDGVPDLHWYFAYNLFRLTGIVQGVKKRMLEGNASNAKAEVTAKLLHPLARVAWEQAEKAGAV